MKVKDKRRKHKASYETPQVCVTVCGFGTLFAVNLSGIYYWSETPYIKNGAYVQKGTAK